MGYWNRRRHDPDDCEGLVPELKGAAQHRRVRTELSLPQAIAQDDGVGATRRGGVVLFREESAPEAPGSRRAEKTARADTTAPCKWSGSRGPIRVKSLRSENSHALEDVIPCPPIKEVRIGRRQRPGPWRQSPT